MKNLTFTIIITLSAFVGVFAQRQPDTGFQAANSYVGGSLDAVNVRNGNVLINLPIASLPGRPGSALSGVASLQYNSKLWKAKQESFTDHIQGGQNTYAYTTESVELSEHGGWKMLMGYRTIWTDRLNLENPNPCVLGHQVEKMAFRWKLEMEFPDGSIRQFVPYTSYSGTMQPTNDGYSHIDFNGSAYFAMTQTHPQNNLCSVYTENSAGGGGMNFVSTDGSRLRLFIPYVANEAPSDSNLLGRNWKLYSMDGTTVENRPPDDSTVGQRITDRNGNKIEIKGGTIVDQFGREMGVGFDGADLDFGITYGTRYVYRKYKRIGYRSGETVPWDTDRWTEISTPISVVSQITLPTQAGGQSYLFDYYADTSSPTSYTNGWGELKSVTLPTGAKITFTYQSAQGTDTEASEILDNKAIYRDLEHTEVYDGQSTLRTERTEYDSAMSGWSVLHANGVGETKGTYHSTGIVRSWLEGLPMQSYTSNGPRVEKLWKHNLPGVASGTTLGYVEGNANAFVKTEFTSIKNTSGQWSLTAIKDFETDKNGNVTKITEYDWVAYGTIPRDSGSWLPTGIPSGATVKRITVNEYYNQAPDSSSSSTSSVTYDNASSPKLKNLIKSTEIQDASNVVKARTEYYYDYIDYNSSNTKAGNLTETRVWDSTKGALNSPDSNGSKLVSGSSGNAISSFATYDTTGNVQTTTDANGVITHLTYGNVVGPDGNVTGLYPTETIVAYGTDLARTSTATYDFYTGAVLSTPDEDNDITNSAEYDALARPIKSISATGTALESWTQTTYDDINRMVIAKADLEAIGDAKKIAVQYYDQLGRVRLSRTLEDALTQDPTDKCNGIGQCLGVKVQTRYMPGNPDSYQITSNPYSTTNATGASGEQTMGWTRSKSNAYGLHSEVESFAGSTLPSPWGNNSDSTGKVVTDIDINRTLVSDQAGKQRISKTNALGQLTDVYEIMAASDASTTSVAFPNTSIAYGYVTSYAFDTLNNLTTVTQGSQTRTFAYNSLSRLTSATNPESGTIMYGYDPNGNLTSKVDARSRTTSYVYDVLNRVTDRDYSDSTPDVDYFYGITAPKVGKLTKVTSSVSTTEYTSFDILGRVTGHKQTTDGVDYTTGYTYRLSGALDEQTYPSGRVVKNELDASGDLSSVTSKANSSAIFKTYANDFTYNAAGAVSSLKLGNGRFESTTFNSRLQPTQIGLGTSETTQNILKLEYGYGTTANNGNVQSQTITVSTVGANTGFSAVQTYTYDELNRLKSATENVTPHGGSQSQSWKQTYTFDRFGNRRFDFTGSNTTSPASNCTEAICNPTVSTTDNRLTSTGWQYDNAGNTTRDGEYRTFTYDGENKQTLVKNSSNATIGEYFYSGDGKRVKKVVPSTGETTVFVYDAAGKLIGEYSTIVANTTDAKVAYLTNDHLGSPRVTTDAIGQTTSRRDFMPYGEEIARSNYGIDSVREKFATYERDFESGIDFAQARYFGSISGRFLSPDPLLSSGRTGNPQTWNRFAYVIGNPLKMNDPLGLFEWSTELGGSTTSDEFDVQLESLRASRDGKGKDEKKRINAQIDRIKEILSRRTAVLSGLKEARKAANNLSGSQQAAVNSSVDAYGSEHEKNGVIIGVGDANQTGQGIAGIEDGSVIVAIRPDQFMSDTLFMTLAHEGSHVIVAQRGILLNSPPMATRFPISGGEIRSSVTARETEYNAYSVSFWAAKGNNFSKSFGIGSNIFYQPGWKEIDANRLDQALGQIGRGPNDQAGRNGANWDVKGQWR